MTRKQIIDLALNDSPCSDALAIFVTSELAATYEPDCNDNTQLHIAAHVLQRAGEDLQAASESVLQAIHARALPKAA